MITKLPHSLNVDGVEYAIRTDYGAVLDCIAALNDRDLDEREKAIVVLSIIYLDPKKITALEEALKQAMWFINCGDDAKVKTNRKLMDWQQDFSMIVSEVNKVLTYDCRSVENLHWWTFMSAYMAIDGDCFLKNVIQIRYKKSRSKKLEKWEQEFYRENRDIIDFKSDYSDEEDEFFKKLGV